MRKVNLRNYKQAVSLESRAPGYLQFMRDVKNKRREYTLVDETEEEEKKEDRKKTEIEIREED
jgi:hypothetical protein